MWTERSYLLSVNYFQEFPWHDRQYAAAHVGYSIFLVWWQSLNLKNSRSLTFNRKILISPFGALTVEKAGRRKLLIFSFVGMGICMAVMAGCISQAGNKAAADTAVAFIFLYVFFYVTGCIGLTYLYCSEVAPLAVRTQITGMSTASSWTFNFLVVEVTPDGFSSLGWKYFIIYAVINLALLVPSKSSKVSEWFSITERKLTYPVVYFFFPETKGLHLEAIDNIFLESKNIWHPVRAARELRRDLPAFGQTGQADDEEKTKEKHEEYAA